MYRGRTIVALLVDGDLSLAVLEAIRGLEDVRDMILHRRDRLDKL